MTLGHNSKRARGTLAEKLEAYSIPEPNSGCLLWLGSCDDDGYGFVRDGDVVIRAHRAAWEVKNGPIPEGKRACHKCDVTSCINDQHLFLGSDLDNAADRGRKGRSARGARNGKTTLLPADVVSIRRDPRTAPAVGRDFGISANSVRNIRRGDRWGHIQ